MQRFWQVFIGLTGCGCVALGAAASHAVADPLAAAALERAALYGILHAIVLLVILNWPGRIAQLARTVFALGIVDFTGSITLKYLGGVAEAGQLAPIGGTLLMFGWLMLIFARR